MNLQERKDLITEMPLGNNLAYILNDNALFLTTEYKVMHSQKDDALIKCMKMIFNDKIQLFYLKKQLRTLSSLMPVADVDSMRLLINNFILGVLNIKSNGFLTCENIDIQLDHVFVDPATYKVYLIYLPINKKWFDNYSFFENELRSTLIKAISNLSPIADTPQMKQLKSDLEDGRLTLEDVYSHMRIGDDNSAFLKDQRPPVSNSVLHIVAINAIEQLELVVDKDEYVIGRNASIVDGVVSFNKAISRQHCMIRQNNGQFTISDLKSAGGTFVNGQRIAPNQQHPIQNGDIVRLANSDFKVEIR